MKENEVQGRLQKPRKKVYKNDGDFLRFSIYLIILLTFRAWYFIIKMKIL